MVNGTEGTPVTQVGKLRKRVIQAREEGKPSPIRIIKKKRSRRARLIEEKTQEFAETGTVVTGGRLTPREEQLTRAESRQVAVRGIQRRRRPVATQRELIARTEGVPVAQARAAVRAEAARRGEQIPSGFEVRQVRREVGPRPAVTPSQIQRRVALGPLESAAVRTAGVSPIKERRKPMVVLDVKRPGDIDDRSRALQQDSRRLDNGFNGGPSPERAAKVEAKIQRLQKREARLTKFQEAIIKGTPLEARPTTGLISFAKEFVRGIPRGLILGATDIPRVAGRVAFAATTLDVPGTRRELKTAGRRVPAALAEGFDPKTPQGLANLAIAAFGVRGIGKARATARGIKPPKLTSQEIVTQRFITAEQVADISQVRVKALVGKTEVSLRGTARQTFQELPSGEIAVEGQVSLAGPTGKTATQIRGRGVKVEGGFDFATIGKQTQKGKTTFFKDVTQTGELVTEPQLKFRTLSRTARFKTDVPTTRPTSIGAGITQEIFIEDIFRPGQNILRKQVKGDTGRIVSTEFLLESRRVGLSPREAAKAIEFRQPPDLAKLQALEKLPIGESLFEQQRAITREGTLKLEQAPVISQALIEKSIQRQLSQIRAAQPRGRGLGQQVKGVGKTGVVSARIQPQAPGFVGLRQQQQQIPFQAPVPTGRGPILAAAPRLAPVSLTGRLPAVSPLTAVRPAQISRPTTKIKPITKAKPVSRLKPESLPVQALSPLQAAAAAQRTISKQRATTLQRQLQRPIAAQRPTTGPILSPFVAQAQIPLRFAPGLPDKPKKAAAAIPIGTEGYNVFGKSKGKFIKLNDKLLTQQNALSLGARAVDNTTSRTFKIKRAGTIKKPRQPDPFFNQNREKFRRKIRKGQKVPQRPRQKTFVEKTNFAIDTAGEVRGIPLEAFRRRRAGTLKTKKKRKKSKTKRSKKK